MPGDKRNSFENDNTLGRAFDRRNALCCLRGVFAN